VQFSVFVVHAGGHGQQFDREDAQIHREPGGDEGSDDRADDGTVNASADNDRTTVHPGPDNRCSSASGTIHASPDNARGTTSAACFHGAG
jgi:hypothetical protein